MGERIVLVDHLNGRNMSMSISAYLRRLKVTINSPPQFHSRGFGYFSNSDVLNCVCLLLFFFSVSSFLFVCFDVLFEFFLRLYLLTTVFSFQFQLKICYLRFLSCTDYNIHSYLDLNIHSNLFSCFIYTK